MINSDNNQTICNNCGNDVYEDDDFCPNCGALFFGDEYCNKHGLTKAEGVCVICCEPYCEKCAEWVNNIYLCYEHNHYEIIQGMACVYAISDELTAHYVFKELEQAGLHPFNYKRLHKPISLENSPLGTMSNEQVYKYNEVKIMIPFQEVIEAEKVLDDLEIE